MQVTMRINIQSMVRNTRRFNFKYHKAYSIKKILKYPVYFNLKVIYKNRNDNNLICKNNKNKETVLINLSKNLTC